MKPHPSLKNYQVVETEDGSTTLFSNHYNEACHSLSGARQETQLHYIKACQVLEKVHEKNPLSILEIGFGTGIGLEETLKALKDSSTPVFFYSTEIDPELIQYYCDQRKIEPDIQNKKWSWRQNQFQVIVFEGDARKTLGGSDLSVDCIYQDAFSPKRNPELWTVEWFKLLKNLSHKKVILSTYSASSSIRKSMLEAGWKISKGQPFGPKRSATIAKLEGESDPEILDHLNRSPVLATHETQMNIYEENKNL